MTSPTNKSKKNALKEYIKSSAFKNDVKEDLESLGHLLKNLTLGTAGVAAPADIYFFLLWAGKNATGNETLKNIAIVNGITFATLLVGTLFISAVISACNAIETHRIQSNGYGPAIKKQFTKLKNKFFQTYTQHNTKIK